MAKTFTEISTKGLAFIKKEEGTILYVYDDAVAPTKRYTKGTKVRGTLTAGVGHTNPTDIQAWIGKDIPVDVVNRWLDWDLDAAESTVFNIVKVPLLPNQRDVLISFTFNAGVTAFTTSTLLKKVNQKKFGDVPTELAKWTKTTINGKKVTSPGLVKRRANEAAMWTGNVKVSGTQVATPESQPLSISEIATGAGAILSPAAGFANSTGFVSYAFGAAVIIAVVIIGIIVLKRYVFNK